MINKNQMVTKCFYLESNELRRCRVANKIKITDKMLIKINE